MKIPAVCRGTRSYSASATVGHIYRYRFYRLTFRKLRWTFHTVGALLPARRSFTR